MRGPRVWDPQGHLTPHGFRGVGLALGAFSPPLRGWPSWACAGRTWGLLGAAHGLRLQEKPGLAPSLCPAPGRG